MNVTPKTEKEIAEMNLWEKGPYPFQIAEAEEGRSKAGNDMIVLKVHVYRDDGSFKIVDDYLLDAIPHKLRHIAEICGQIEQYNTGKLEALSLVGHNGTCKLAVQKDKEGKYPDKNVIQDYMVPKEGEQQKTVHIQDDSIPF